MLNHISCEESKLLREKNERMLNVGSCLEFKTLSPAWKRSLACVLGVERYRALVGGCRRIPRRLSEHAGVRVEAERKGVFLILQKYSAAYKPLALAFF